MFLDAYGVQCHDRVGVLFFTGHISVLGAQMKYERLCDGVHLPQIPLALA